MSHTRTCFQQLRGDSAQLRLDLARLSSELHDFLVDPSMGRSHGQGFASQVRSPSPSVVARGAGAVPATFHAQYERHDELQASGFSVAHVNACASRSDGYARWCNTSTSSCVGNANVAKTASLEELVISRAHGSATVSSCAKVPGFDLSSCASCCSVHHHPPHQCFEGGVVDDNIEARIRMDRTLSVQAPENMLLRKIVGDGNCLFRALSAGLFRAKGVHHTHEELRRMIIHQIIACPALHSRFYDSVDFNNYIADMSKDGFYGDELCIRSFVECLRVGVRVHHPRGMPITFGDGPGCIHLARNGRNHFDVYVPKPGPDISLSTHPFAEEDSNLNENDQGPAVSAAVCDSQARDDDKDV